MTIPASVILKLTRAREHVVHLQVETDYYLDTRRKPEIFIETYRHMHGTRWRIVGKWRQEDTPPDRIAVFVGDAVHNLRSALDHLACALVETVPGNKVRTGSGGTQFPIYTSPTNDKDNPRQISVAGGVPPGALALIKSLQPYERTPQAPESDPLAIISNLDNVDKHRTLNLAACYLSKTRFRVVLSDGTEVNDITAPPLVLDDPETQVFDHPMAAPFGKVVEVESEGQLGIALKEPGPGGLESVSSLLERLFDYVAGDVIPQFAEFF